MSKFDKVYKQFLESNNDNKDSDYEKLKRLLAPEIPDAEKADFNPNPGPDDSIYPTRWTKPVPDNEMYKALGNRTLEQIHDELDSAKFKGNVFPVLMQVYKTIQSNVDSNMYSKYINRLWDFLKQDPDLAERIATDQIEWMEKWRKG